MYYTATTGDGNTAVGYNSSTINFNRHSNTSTVYSLDAATTAHYNTAIGFNAIVKITTTGHCTAVGNHSQFENSSASFRCTRISIII